MSDGYPADSEPFGDTSEAGGDAGEEPAEASPEDGADATEDAMTVHPDAVDREFDWRGWTLVSAVVVAFLVIPSLILLYPHVGSRLGLTFWDAYLALPMVPAVVLGLLAVWATTRP
jgi:hypothetical protein